MLACNSDAAAADEPNEDDSLGIAHIPLTPAVLCQEVVTLPLVCCVLLALARSSWRFRYDHATVSVTALCLPDWLISCRIESRVHE